MAKKKAKKRVIHKKKVIRRAEAKSKIKQKKSVPPAKKEKKIDEAMLKKPKNWIVAFLSLGSNVGDREEYIEQAVFLLSKISDIKIVKRASNYESEAEIVSKQPPFINSVVQIKTKLSPYGLLDTCHDIENTLGREREIEWGPRTIDVDILFYDDQVISDDRLTIPHPMMHERLFVLEPIAEIAPSLVHPVLDKRMKVLYDEKHAEMGEKYDDELPGFKNIKSGVYDDFERW